MEKQGFTLIEVLIVVAIIAILSSVILIGLGPAQRAGRDSRRISDLRQIQTGLELYYNKCGFYPGIAQSGPTCTGPGGGTDFTGMAGALTGSGLNIANVPHDPSNSPDYEYGSTAPGATYHLGAKLEDASNRAFNDSATNGDGLTNCGLAGGWYCVSL